MSINPKTHNDNFSLACVGDICDVYCPMTGVIVGSTNIIRMTPTQVLAYEGGSVRPIRFSRIDGTRVGDRTLGRRLLLRRDQTRRI